jgi:hypothetical protein
MFVDTTSGTFETTDSIDINFQAASSVGEAWDALCQTGSLDIVLEPVWDPVGNPGILWRLNIYAQAGADKPGSVFAWGRAPFSLAGITRVEDGTLRANNEQLYTADVSHPVTLQTDSGSVTKYGQWWEQDVLSDLTVDAATTAIAIERLRLAKNGKTTVSLSPFPERSPIPFMDYDRGDRVKVIAPKDLRKPINGFCRIYGIPIQVGDDQIETISQLLTSPDGVS